MSERVILQDAERMYSLSQTESGNYVLAVVCGGVGMYEVRLGLTTEEAQSFERAGRSYLDELALRVCKNRGAFTDRLI
jgi:hypothetical protein